MYVKVSIQFLMSVLFSGAFWRSFSVLAGAWCTSSVRGCTAAPAAPSPAPADIAQPPAEPLYLPIPLLFYFNYRFYYIYRLRLYSTSRWKTTFNTHEKQLLKNNFVHDILASKVQIGMSHLQAACIARVNCLTLFYVRKWRMKEL